MLKEGAENKTSQSWLLFVAYSGHFFLLPEVWNQPAGLFQDSTFILPENQKYICLPPVLGVCLGFNSLGPPCGG